MVWVYNEKYPTVFAAYVFTGVVELNITVWLSGGEEVRPGYCISSAGQDNGGIRGKKKMDIKVDKLISL